MTARLRHDARVTTRRIRAALPFVAGIEPGVPKRIRHIGRALGRVRELDVSEALLGTFEARIPEAAAAVALLRREVRNRAARQRRRMIKALNVPPRAIAHALVRNGARARLASLWRDWRRELRRDVWRRAVDASAAIDRATAVYMPNRSHAARIAVKKLRYALDVGVATRSVDAAPFANDIKAVQASLGELHDLHVLASLIDAVEFPDSPATHEAARLSSAIAFESSRLHAKYLKQREHFSQVLAQCRDMARHAHDGVRIPTAAVPLALVAVPVAAWYAATLPAGGRESADRDRLPLPSH